MQVIVLVSVKRFLNGLGPHLGADVDRTISLLEEYGHLLSMPVAKPIGKGLWELRVSGRPAVRILYAFCNGDAILLHGLKKQRPALLPREVALALKRLGEYCG